MGTARVGRGHEVGRAWARHAQPPHLRRGVAARPVRRVVEDALLERGRVDVPVVEGVEADLVRVRVRVRVRVSVRVRVRVSLTLTLTLTLTLALTHYQQDVQQHAERPQVHRQAGAGGGRVRLVVQLGRPVRLGADRLGRAVRVLVRVRVRVRVRVS